MRIAVGSDHAGFTLKPVIVGALQDRGHTVIELPSFTDDPVDFPDVVVPVCEAVLNNDVDRGVLVCGTGIGACMAANKIAGIRAALCHDVHSAHQSVEHDNANVLCLGAKIIGEWLAVDLLAAFVDARFSDQDHFRRRIAKMDALESAYRTG
jgi:ribose 5-phosphate isomerase B